MTPKTFDWIDEYHEGVRYGLKGEILFYEQSEFQEIKVVESVRYGKGLLLDDRWMTAEYQEKEYHESLVQPAICTAANIKKILIIGGGDGGTARECLQHQETEQIDLVEIDRRVIEISKTYLPSIGGNAWEDSRLNVIIGDGVSWVSKTKTNEYDVILVDGSDPIGPAKGLFNKAFFIDCKRILKPGGVLGTQSESPESFLEIHLQLIKILRGIFDYADPIYGSVPIYPSGWWSWTFAADQNPIYLHPKEKRANCISDKCHLWSPRWHHGAFNAMPAFIERSLLK